MTISGTDAVTSFKVRENGNEGARQSIKWTLITATKVETAAKALREGEVDIGRDIMEMFCGKEWETDQTGVDCLIQFIAFGKIVFG